MNKPDDISDDAFMADNEQVEMLKKLCDDGEVAYCCVQYERGGESHRLHGQGFLVLKKKHAKNWLINRLSSHTSIRSRKAEVSDDENGRNYCWNQDKEGFVAYCFEYGNYPDSIALSEVQARKPSQRDAVASCIKNGDTFREIQVKFPGYAFEKERMVKRAIANIASENKRAKFVQTREVYVAKKWQHWLWQYLIHVEPDDRVIIQISDKVGNSGKNRFMQEFEDAQPEGEVQQLNAGKEADLNLAFLPTVRVLFLNITRCKAEHVSHIQAFCENIKDGAVFCSKYDSEMKKFAPPHVVIFTNDEVNIGYEAEGYYPGRAANTGQIDMHAYSVTGKFSDRHPDANIVVPRGSGAPFTYDRYLWWDLNDELREPFDPNHDPNFPPFNALTEKFERIRFVPAAFGPAYQGDNAGDGPAVDQKAQIAVTRNTKWPIPADRYTVVDGVGYWWCMWRGDYISPDPESGESVEVYWKYDRNLKAPWYKFTLYRKENLTTGKMNLKSKKENVFKHPDWTPHLPPTFWNALGKMKERESRASGLKRRHSVI